MGTCFGQLRAPASPTAAEVDEERRALAFLRDHDLDEDSASLRRWTPSQRARLARLLEGDCASSTAPTFADELANFLRRRGAREEDYTFFWDTWDGPRALLQVLRCQRSGLCFMHAPVVLQHYLIVLHRWEKHRDASASGMIDVSEYIQHYRRGDSLREYLLHDRGGSSLEFLREITQDPALDLESLIVPRADSARARLCAELQRDLRDLRRPWLVSMFSVDRAFLRGDDVHFTGEMRPAERLGNHAMLLIGARYYPERRQYGFVLQNWWSGRHFLEVSDSYLQSAGAILTRVLTPLTRIPCAFPVLHTTYAETAMDARERTFEMWPGNPLGNPGGVP